MHPINEAVTLDFGRQLDAAEVEAVAGGVAPVVVAFAKGAAAGAAAGAIGVVAEKATEKVVEAVKGLFN